MMQNNMFIMSAPMAMPPSTPLTDSKPSQSQKNKKNLDGFTPHQGHSTQRKNTDSLRGRGKSPDRSTQRSKSPARSPTRKISRSTSPSKTHLNTARSSKSTPYSSRSSGSNCSTKAHGKIHPETSRAERKQKEFQAALRNERRRNYGSSKPTPKDYEHAKKALDDIGKGSKDNQKCHHLEAVWGKIVPRAITVYLEETMQTDLIKRAIIKPYEKMVARLQKRIVLTNNTKAFICTEKWKKYIRDYKPIKSKLFTTTFEGNDMVLKGDKPVRLDKNKIKKFIKKNAFVSIDVKLTASEMDFIHNNVYDKLKDIYNKAKKKSVRIMAEMSDSKTGFNLFGEKSTCQELKKDIQKLIHNMVIVTQPIFLRDVLDFLQGRDISHGDISQMNKHNLNIQVRDTSDFCKLPEADDNCCYFTRAQGSSYSVYISEGDVNSSGCGAKVDVSYETSKETNNNLKCSWSSCLASVTLPTEPNQSTISSVVQQVLDYCGKEPVYSVAFPVFYEEEIKPNLIGAMLKTISQYFKVKGSSVLSEVHIIAKKRQNIPKINVQAKKILPSVTIMAGVDVESEEQKQHRSLSPKVLQLVSTDTHEEKKFSNLLKDIEERFNNDNIQPAILFPKPWEPMSFNTPSQTFNVEKDCEEWDDVKRAFEEGCGGLIISQIKRVQNPMLYQRVISAAKEQHGSSNESHLWHGIRAKQIDRFLNNGFKEGMYSFSVDPFDVLILRERGRDSLDDKHLLYCTTFVPIEEDDEDRVILKNKFVYHHYLVGYN